jgi:hypothetical protein
MAENNDNSMTTQTDINKLLEHFSRNVYTPKDVQVSIYYFVSCLGKPCISYNARISLVSLFFLIVEIQGLSGCIRRYEGNEGNTRFVCHLYFAVLTCSHLKFVELKLKLKVHKTVI